MDEDSEWDDFGHDDSSDDDSSHGNDSNDLQNLDPDDFGTSDVGSWLQENRHSWKTAPAIEDWTRIRTACSTSKKALESEIEKLTGKLGKVEGNITELQKKSTQQSYLLDEVAEKIKSSNASNTSNVPKLHQQSQNHTQALLTSG